MRHSLWRTSPALLAGCALGLAGVSCSTEEVQLESMYVSQSLEGLAQIGADQENATCLTVMSVVGEETSYEVRLNGRPLRMDSESRAVLRVGGVPGDVMFCVAAGDFNLSLVAGNSTVAQTGVISMRAGAQHVFQLRGDRHAPGIDVDEIDMSSPGPGLRRVRVTNLSEAKQPIEIFFYDGQDRLHSSTGPIAYGETFATSLPIDVTWWRYSEDDEYSQGLSPGTGASRPSDGICLEKPPAGLVLARPPQPRDVAAVYYVAENYLQRPQACTVDTTVCSPERCIFQGW